MRKQKEKLLPHSLLHEIMQKEFARNSSTVTVISEICCKFASEKGNMEIKDIHPLTIITDRYGGIYSEEPFGFSIVRGS